MKVYNNTKELIIFAKTKMTHRYPLYHTYLKIICTKSRSVFTINNILMKPLPCFFCDTSKIFVFVKQLGAVQTLCYSSAV